MFRKRYTNLDAMVKRSIKKLNSNIEDSSVIKDIRAINKYPNFSSLPREKRSLMELPRKLEFEVTKIFECLIKVYLHSETYKNIYIYIYKLCIVLLKVVTIIYSCRWNGALTFLSRYSLVTQHHCSWHCTWLKNTNKNLSMVLHLLINSISLFPKNIW